MGLFSQVPVPFQGVPQNTNILPQSGGAVGGAGAAPSGAQSGGVQVLPPAAGPQVERFCVYVNINFNTKSPIHNCTHFVHVIIIAHYDIFFTA